MDYGFFLILSHAVFHFGVDKQERLKKRRSLSSFAKGLGFVFEVDKRKFCCYICVIRKPNTWRTLYAVTAQKAHRKSGPNDHGAPGGYTRRFLLERSDEKKWVSNAKARRTERDSDRGTAEVETRLVGRF